MSAAKHPPLSLAWSIWGVGAALYFVAFYQRVAPAVITAELSQTFSLTAASLGHLSAFYFYSYVAMQIPTGILADRIGARRLLAVGALVAAIGTAVFASATDVSVANAGRLLIGGAAGVAFVAMLKLASVWMPTRHFAIASATALAIGVAGAVGAGAPLRLLVDHFGWRVVMWVSAGGTLLIALAAWAWVRDDPAERGYTPYLERVAASAQSVSIWAGLREVMSYRNSWLIFFASGAMTGLVLTFAGLWGVPYLTTHYQLTQAQAAGVCSLMMITWALGTLVFSSASDRLGRRKPLYFAGIVGALSCWAAAIHLRFESVQVLTLLLAAAGFGAGSFILSFAFAKESVPARLAGTASGVANMGVISGPMVLQPLVGWWLDRSVSMGSATASSTFSWEAYAQAFSLNAVWCVLALVLLAFTRETYCGRDAAAGAQKD